MSEKELRRVDVLGQVKIGELSLKEAAEETTWAVAGVLRDWEQDFAGMEPFLIRGILKRM